MNGTFSFYGGSDDLIEIDHPDGSSDEIGSYDKPWFGLLTAPDGQRVEVVELLVACQDALRKHDGDPHTEAEYVDQLERLISDALDDDAEAAGR